MTDVTAIVRDHGESACALLNRISPSDPNADRKLAEVSGHLLAMRDDLILAQRGGQDCREPLSRTNAIISAMFGLEFPHAGLQWARLCETRDGLQHLLDEMRAHDGRGAARGTTAGA